MIATGAKRTRICAGSHRLAGKTRVFHLFQSPVMADLTSKVDTTTSNVPLKWRFVSVILRDGS